MLLLCVLVNFLGFVVKFIVILFYVFGYLDVLFVEVGNLFFIIALLGLAIVSLSGLAADKFGKKVVVGVVFVVCVMGLFFGV